MNENNFNVLFENVSEYDGIETIGFLHTIVWEAVHEMGGDDYDYDDVLDIIGV